jgi:hypothetical protein
VLSRRAFARKQVFARFTNAIRRARKPAHKKLQREGLLSMHLEFPFAGSRMLRGLLAAEGCKIGRRHVKTLMRRMGIEALYRRPHTTTARARPQDLPAPAARDGDHPAEPSLGDGHHVHPDGARLRLSGRRARLVQPSRTVVAVVDHDGSGILRRDA